jgi:hypothetical protein
MRVFLFRFQTVNVRTSANEDDVFVVSGKILKLERLRTRIVPIVQGHSLIRLNSKHLR